MIEIIVDGLCAADLAAAASVSLAWVYPSQKRLYSEVTISDHTQARECMTRLAATLADSENIRLLIRKVVFVYHGHLPLDATLFQWMRLLSADTVRTLAVHDDYEHFPGPEFAHAVYVCPGLSALQHLCLSEAFSRRGSGAVKVFYQGENAIGEYMHLSNLKTLDIGLWFKELGPPSQFSHLERLALSVDSYRRGLHPVMRHLRGSLVRLTIYFACWSRLDGNIATTLAKDLSKCKRLMYLSINHERVTDKVGNVGPFLDIVIAKLPKLRCIYCPFGTFTSRFFEHIPRKMQHMRLETMELHAAEVQELCARKKTGNSDLKLLEIGGWNCEYEGPLLWDELSPPLVDACEAVGITFRQLERELRLQYPYSHENCTDA